MIPYLPLFSAGQELASVMAGIFGLLVGSFLNVVIYRLPKMLMREIDSFIAEHQQRPPPHTTSFNLMVPRSTCPHCGHVIKAYENIPLFSFFLLKGKCASCESPIGVRYPLIELVSALLSFAMVAYFGFTLAGMASLIFVYFLIALAVIDWDTQLLPDQLTLPLLWIGLLVNTQALFCALEDAVLGAVLGYLILWSIYWIFKLLTGKEGMGYGDFKLLAALGAWCGATALPGLVLLSSLLGSIVGLGYVFFKGHRLGQPIPFGPYLVIAGLIVLPFPHFLISLV